MKKIKVHTLTKKISGDLLTPVGIYLKIRDRYKEPLLLESSDYHSNKNSKSFICFEPLASIMVKHDEVVFINGNVMNVQPKSISLNETVEEFSTYFEIDNKKQSLFGYTSYEALQLMEDIKLKKISTETDIPLAIYSL
ncbi:MAG: anthranilate synthase component I family protein, partial [Bacteroidia bacterium]